MTATFEYKFDTSVYKGTSTLHTGLFIGGKWIDPVEGGNLEVVNPTNNQPICSVSAGTAKDIDIAVTAAREAYKKAWGLNVPGVQRGQLLNKLADLVETHQDELAALESLNTGKPFGPTRHHELGIIIKFLRYFAAWADKVSGETFETTKGSFGYTRREPYGVVGLILPWNAPLVSLALKLGPALATGNAVIIKPSEITPLTALRFADLINEAGYPAGTVNIVNGHGSTAGQAIAEHHRIAKVSFTGSTLVGRRIQEASAKSNLKVVTLELGGKSPNIIFDDANIETSLKHTVPGIFGNMGQMCTASSRIFVQEGIYDAWIAAFKSAAEAWGKGCGDPFAENTFHGPQVSKTQLDRVMGYINAGTQAGATIAAGGQQIGSEGNYIHPTIFTGVTPEMSIYKEEIFGPVASVIKFKTEEEVLELANDTTYGLASAVFTENLSRAIRVSNGLEAGVAFVNCYNSFDCNMPFGGYKQSGIGRENGKYVIEAYTQVKSVYINL